VYFLCCSCRIEQAFEELAQSLVLRKQKLIGEVDMALTTLAPLQQEANTFLSQLMSMEEELKKTLADKLPPTILIKQASVHRDRFSTLETTRSDLVAHAEADFKGAIKEELNLDQAKIMINSCGSIRTQLVSHSHAQLFKFDCLCSYFIILVYDDSILQIIQ
jgi:hypothetical protein